MLESFFKGLWDMFGALWGMFGNDVLALLAVAIVLLALVIILNRAFGRRSR